MYCAGAPMPAINSITARQIDFRLIARPPDCSFPALVVGLLPFQFTPPPPDLQDFGGERVQFLFDPASVFQGVWTRIAARQRERADGLARRRRDARDQLIDME